MLPYLREHFGNPSSVHWAGRAVSGALENAREQVAALLHAEPGEIIFTSGGSEGLNTALKGAANQLSDRGRHIITTAVEHPAVLESCAALENRGWEVTRLSVDRQGQLDLQELEAAIRPQTVLIEVMAANNETGNLYPLTEIGAIAARHDILFCSDLVQAAGRVPLDVRQAGLDLAVISGHKFGAPKGIGALYVRNGLQLEPLIHGGHQERNRRAGTHNVAGIVGLGQAATLARTELEKTVDEVAALRDRLEQGIFAQLAGVQLNGCAERGGRLPNTLNLSFAGISGESLLLNLDLKGIAASSGSACSSGTLEPSHVLAALGVEPALAQASIRFSLGYGNNAEQIDLLLAELPPIVERLRSISPFTA